MPKAILEFSLPEEAVEHRLALDALRYKLALSDMDEWLRQQIKHGDRSSPVELGDIRDKLWEILSDHDVEDLHCG